MSAAYLDLAWDNQSESDSLEITFTPVRDNSLVRKLGAKNCRPVRCPECHSIVYSRRHRLCGVCNQPLPEHLLFTAMEAQRVEQLLQVERSRHRLWMEQRDPTR